MTDRQFEEWKRGRQKRAEELTKDKSIMEMVAALGEYAEKFGTFPTYCFQGSYDEMVKCAKDCVEQGKDAYELGYIPLPEDTEGIIY